MKIFQQSILAAVVIALGLRAVAIAQPGRPAPPPPPPDGSSEAPVAPEYAPSPPPPPPPPPPPQPYAVPVPVYAEGPYSGHRGFLASVAIGFGEQIFRCSGCGNAEYAGVAVDLSIGGFLAPRLAIMYDATLVAHAEDSIVGNNVVNGVGVQYWAAPRLSVKGAVGLGRYIVSGDGISIEIGNGLGLSTAVAYEVFQGRRGFTIDVRARLSHVIYEDAGVTNLGVLAGFSWY